MADPMRGLPRRLDYPSGSPAVRLNSQGEGFIFYPSDPGGKQFLAASVSAVSSYQRRFVFFDDPRRLRDPSQDGGAGGPRRRQRLRDTSGLPPRTAAEMPHASGGSSRRAASGPVVCAMNEHLEGFAVCNMPAEAAAPFRKALFSADGATLTGMHGEVKDPSTGASLDAHWRWDPAKQSAGRPPSAPVTIPLTPSLTFRFVSRRECSVAFAASGVSLTVDVSEVLRRPPGTAYTDLATTGSDPVVRGRRVPDTSHRVPLARRAASSGPSARRKPASGFRNAALASLVSDLDDAMAGVRSRAAGGPDAKAPYLEPGWKEAAHAQTLREVPRLMGLATGALPVVPAADSLTAELLKGVPSRGGVAALPAEAVDRAIAAAAAGFEAEAAATRGRLAAELGLTTGIHGARARGAGGRGGGRRQLGATAPAAVAGGGGSLGRRAGQAGAGAGTGAGGAGSLASTMAGLPSAGFGAAEGLSDDVADALDRTWGQSIRLARAQSESASSTMGGRGLGATAGMGASGLGATGSSMGGGSGDVDGYGGAAGASLCGGKWLNDVETKHRLRAIHPALPRAGALAAASGRYADSGPSAAAYADATAIPVPSTPSGPALDAWIESAGSAAPDQLIVMACLRGEEAASRALSRTLRGLQATLRRLYPHSSDFASDALLSEAQRAKWAAEAHQAGVSGVGGDGRQSPLLLRRVRMEEQGEWVARRFGVRSLPMLLAFWRGRLVFRGTMGGATVVRVPTSDRPCNVLLVEPSAAAQRATERVLRAGRWSWALASGRYDAQAASQAERLRGRAAEEGSAGEGSSAAVFAGQPGVVGLAEEAQLRLREAADAAKRSADVSRGSAALPPGTQASAQMPDDFALVLVAAAAGPREAQRIAAAVGRAGASAGGACGGTGGVTPRLCGRSLVVSVLPRGSVLPGQAPAVLPVSPARATTSSPVGAEAWACPRTGVVVGAGDAHLLGGAASVAVVAPIKPASLAALSAMWRQCLHARGEAAGASRLAASAKAQQRAGAGGAGLLLPGQLAGAQGEGDGAHLGLTHNDLLERLVTLRQDASMGRAKPCTDAVMLPASETVVRGTRLTA
ncbi:hypothetical protein FNF31_01382 [Cafeteria roenbergensis]|uniref:FAM194 C-terminal domain-containing protein n=2 Tax=Cafeteria roenbergensis TaxID=33653 RepID=A0A5A8DPF8_CAFRO|nr:hypothetical protein FNF31_01382 [Cafeteria roenbergensis]